MIKESYVNVDGCRLHCLEAGARSAQQVILLHGMKFKAETWQEIGTLEYLADAGFFARAFDMPGFGKSPACDFDTVDVLGKLIDTGVVTKPVLVGPSMGGKISLNFVLDNQELVAGLVLVGAVGVEENRERLASVSLPTLVVWGENDAISALSNAKLLHEKISGSQLEVIANAGHPCYLDETDLWHRILVGFLQNNGF